MFGMNLFKLAGIELPAIDAMSVIEVVITTESNRFERNYDDWNDALTGTLSLLKQHTDVAHISIGKRAA